MLHLSPLSLFGHTLVTLLASSSLPPSVSALPGLNSLGVGLTSDIGSEMMVGRDGLSLRVIYNPPITYPTNSTTWTAGARVRVDWETDKIPEELRNSTGKLQLGHQKKPTKKDPYPSENLGPTLAEGFPLTKGREHFNLPGDLVTRQDYIVVLFGDSGNKSPRFTINAAAGDDGKSPVGGEASSAAGLR